MTDILSDIEKSRNGEVVTIPFIHKKLSKYIFLGRNLYHLIGGASGSGKSAWIDLNYAINPALWVMKYGEEYDVKLKVVLRSMERSKKHRMAKWVCMDLFLEHGLLIDVPTLFGWGVRKNHISEEIYSKVKESVQRMERLEDIIEVVDGATGPTGVYKHLKKEAHNKGTLYKYVINKANGKEQLHKFRGSNISIVQPEECPQAKPFEPHYIPDDDKEITIFIVDHLQAMTSEKGYNDKQNLDKMSEYARELRDIYGFSPVMVSQLNRGVSDTMRRVKTDLMPEDKDFSGSSNMFNDADMAAILFNPYKYGLNNLMKWEVNRCVDKEYGINRFRSLHLLKNTYGPDNIILGYNFIGENGAFYEMPKHEDMTLKHYERVAYPKYTKRLTSYMEEI